MNENAKALYEDLKESRLPQFSMWDVQDDCGAPQCILGHTLERMGVLHTYPSLDVLDTQRAKAYSWLGLKKEIGYSLCFPDNSKVWAGVNPWKATQPEAAEALKRACELSD